ncbi:unnamed protein product [Rotaria sordida]|uniref:Uncharacterized protein n=1 Tax=Rotaria sordida TaxID=392033 RepID=A0A814XQP2_9BILA|nr:unnamed protein product [Rotaria sordida]
MMVFSVSVPEGQLRSHITGGYKNIQPRNSRSDLACSQFISDLDVLDHFPFLIMINPMNNNWQKSTAVMNKNSTVVVELALRSETVVPLSIFCLKNLQRLAITYTPFPNGIVPDELSNLRQLTSLQITDAPIVKMTEQLGTLSNLNSLFLYNSSLTHLPNLSGISRLIFLSIGHNRLSHLDGPNSVQHLYLGDNAFTEIPAWFTQASLRILDMNNNPLEKMLAITSLVNLERLYLSNTSLSFIPTAIDRLQKLEYLILSNNKLFYLPTNMLNLVNLKKLELQNNLFSPVDIQTFQTEFAKSHPNMILII